MNKLTADANAQKGFAGNDQICPYKLIHTYTAHIKQPTDIPAVRCHHCIGPKSLNPVPLFIGEWLLHQEGKQEARLDEVLPFLMVAI